MGKVRRIVSNRWVVLAARLLLGGIFLASAIGKLQHPALFVDTVVDYGMLPDGLARFYGTVLPWAELAVGVSLVLGLLSVAAAAVGGGMTVSFAIAGIHSLINPEDVPTTCGCFGDIVSLGHSQSLAVDAGMLMAAAMIIAGWRSADDPGAMWALKRIARGRPAWLSPALKLAGVTVLTLTLGLAITATSDAPKNGPVTDKPRLLYFWNGCPDCYGPEVEQVESLQPEHGDRVEFVEIDYLRDPSSLSQYGVTEDEFTVLLLARDRSTGQYHEYARYAGHVQAGTFNLAAIRDGLEAMLSQDEQAS